MSEQFTFFYSKTNPFSQFYPCRFKVKEIEFNCCEQFMMYNKALLFGDEEMMAAILAESDPLKIKRYGRQVTPFNGSQWASVAPKVVYRGNYAKFTQNKDLKKILLDTAGTTLVEASPRDLIWGIGLGASNPKALDRRTWRGKNLLGEILTKVREKIIENDNMSMEERLARKKMREEKAAKQMRPE